MFEAVCSQKKLGISNSNKENNIYIWWLNIGIESLWNDKKSSILPQLQNKGNLRTVNRTEQLCFLLAGPNDILIQREKPNRIIIENLKNIGISMPEIWIPKNKGKNDQRPISELILRDEELLKKISELDSINGEVILVPYAITNYEKEISKKTGCRLFGSTSSITAWINSKVNSRLITKELGLPVTEGYICDNIDDLNNYIHKLWKNNGECKIAVKEAYGASGKGIFIIDNRKSAHFLLNILKRKSINIFEDIIVEKWYDTVLDLNYQVLIDEDGNIDYIPPKKQIAQNGLYVGSEFPLKDCLTKEQKLFYEHSAMKIGNRLWQQGYSGFASIDSIITKDNVIFPVIEINGRFSLSTYISFLPHMLGEDKIYISKYYNLKPGVTLIEIWEQVKKYQYTQRTGEGIVIYSFVDSINDNSNGRLFALFISLHRQKISMYDELMISVICNKQSK
ncbi:ATP-grasp domain-containing protein [Vallitalea pronyensis]|uniref:ATP-grasp domain-containing protein n=1 Tax=Vallitalea pronyensis TaxID=1348613 RepID=A0A8J8ML32_9FIRM|nr:ATP-grasp domain-containing protein [Vallitalea pronyensis]QUI23837.1 ATP-grasp domain-containing protein [Vallitalea pronyensis]